jgi:serine/threonine protein kinase
VVRLPDIVACGKRKVSESINIFRNPQAAFYRFARRIFQNAYENAEVSLGDVEQSSSRQPGSSSGPPVRTVRNRKMGSYHAGSRQVLTGSKHSEEAAADDYTELKSRWDRYVFRNEPLEAGDNFLLYRAKANSSDTYVQVKAYTLPEQVLKNKELFRREQWFEQLISQNRKISHSPDFRLVKLLDGIYDRKSRRCYLVTKPFDDTVSLEEYLESIASMDAFQIREVLRQVLETLHFLHEACWIKFPSEKQIKGIPHANLNLHSLLIRRLENPNAPSGEEFFVYVSDLGLWEHLFLPPGPEQFYVNNNLVPNDREMLMQKDLQDLARIAYQLAGGSLTVDGNPKLSSVDWSVKELNDEALGNYLKCLWQTQFSSAWDALEALQGLPETEVEHTKNEFEEEYQEKPPRGINWLLSTFLFLILGFGGVSFLVSRALITHFAHQEANDAEAVSELEDLLLRDVNFTTSTRYGIEVDSFWAVASDRLDVPLVDEERNEEIKADYPNLLSHFYARHQEILQDSSNQDGQGDGENSNSQNSRLAGSTKQVSTEDHAENPSSTRPLTLVNFQDSLKDYSTLAHQIENGTLDVGLVEKLPSETLPGVGNQFNFEPVAYEGLAVFVPFGDAYRSRNSIGELGHKISLNDLRRLYTSYTDEPQLRGQTVKLFFPNNETAINLFKALVLNNDPALISRFDALRQTVIIRDAQAYPNATRADDQTPAIRNNLYEKLLHEFEADGTIGIGFDRLSHMYNQCSVYPLAVSAQDWSAPPQRYRPPSNQVVQPLKQSGGRPIHPTTDLCNAKGRYWLQISDAYPLQVELGVLYSADPEAVAGREFLAMLNTVEGQFLLSQAGLVPKTIPMEHIWREIWGGG